jgi:CheY-like chemotaxis protein
VTNESRLKRTTILIADDDCDLVDVLAARCRRIGLTVIVAHDAFTALSLAKSEQPNIICLDVEMPAGNGLSVGEMLASDEECRCIPVVILTGKDDPGTIMRCHSLCAYYVAKCPDVWSRMKPLIEELLCDYDRAGADRASQPLVPAAHDPLYRG